MADDKPLKLARELWDLHLVDSVRLDKIYDHVHEKSGKPVLPDDASDEVKRIAGMSFKNVLTPVRDIFVQNLSVAGYRSNGIDNLPAWDMWQRNKMDAKQQEVYRPGVTYGTAYVVAVLEDGKAVFRPRSPRQLLAAYRDPQIDEWPEAALELWVETRKGSRFRRGYLYSDDGMVYPIDLGEIPKNMDVGRQNIVPSFTPDATPFESGYDGVPIVRYINRRDAEENIVGEVEALLDIQRAINNTNFDRLIVSRFGAFPQKVISGWQGTKAETLEASARRVWAFAEVDVKATTLQAAELEPYNGLLEEQFIHAALVAQISPTQISGRVVNVSADTLASMAKGEQQKLKGMRETYGEGHKQLLRLGAVMEGSPEPTDDRDEIVWNETEARSFAAVVDGVSKLVASGVPLEHVLHLVPGISPQQIEDIRRKSAVRTLVSELRGPAQNAVTQDTKVAEAAERNEGLDDGVA